MTNIPSDEQLAQMMRELAHARNENWLATDLFTWQWWLMVSIFVIPWIVFYYIADRKQLPRLLLFGTLLMLLIITFDLTGFELGLWNYPYKIFPIGPLVGYVDIGALPIIYMLEYQYYPGWKDFIKASVIIGILFSFCFEPLLVALGLYIPAHWQYYYGLPIYILMPIVVRLGVEKLFAPMNNS